MDDNEAQRPMTFGTVETFATYDAALDAVDAARWSALLTLSDATHYPPALSHAEVLKAIGFYGWTLGHAYAAAYTHYGPMPEHTIR